MAIYQHQYRPYFYIIQDLRNGMYYAGARWAKDANPSELLTENGYTTSSNTVNDIIKSCGLNTFTIRKIRLFDTKEEVLLYETRFLVKVNARSNPSFYNKSNNEGYLEREEAVFLKYGVKHYSQTDEFKNNHQKFSLEKYGYEHHLMSPVIIEKRKQTFLEKYGVDNFTKTEQYIDITKKTNMDRYGVEWYQQIEEVKEKARKTSNIKYGFDHHNKTDEYKEYVRNEKTTKSKRPIVLKIRELKEKTKMKLGKGWYQKSEEELQTILDSLLSIIAE